MFETTLCAPSSSLSSLTDALDRSYARILRGDIAGGMTLLVRDLGFACAGWTQDRWTAASSACLEHPIREALHADPLTLRAFTKPRGYAPDGHLLDLVYRHGAVRRMVEALSPAARAVHEWLASSTLAEAIRWRMIHLARTIDQAAATRPKLRVLCVGAGHLREVELSSAFSRNKLERLVAADGDRAALDVIARDLRGTSAIPLLARPEQLGELDLGTFDLIYSAGAFEELDDERAVQLSSALIAKLDVRGVLVAANLTPVTIERGYMDAFMRWRPRFRTTQALGRILFRASGAIPSLTEDPYLRVAYARIDRAQRS